MPTCVKKYRSLLLKAILCIPALLGILQVMATEEPYLNELKGVKVKTDSFFTVADEKYGNAIAWADIQQTISINDIVSFEINFDTSIYFYSQPFDCTVHFKIYIYGNPADTSIITDSTTHADIALQVRFDTVAGKPYKGIAMYKFAGAHKYKIKILSLTSPQLSPIPAIFRLKGQIIVDRQYEFEDASTDVTRYSVINTNQLKLEWTPSNYKGAEQFDLEYTHIDGASTIADYIRTLESAGNYTVPEDSLAKWFRNNNTRVTTAAASHLLNIPYDSGFILFRIRGVQIHYPDNVRWEGNWNYLARKLSESCSTCPTGVVFFDAHESNLNWQYTATFSEDGKRKEVVGYFDGTLRNRQSVTISNSDNKNIVQETIYDALGRPAVSILPAPTNDSTIHYFRGFNKNSEQEPYSFADISFGSNCVTTADSVSNTSGAGRYYSSNNQFLDTYYYAKYIPNSEGYPFYTTEYMPDKTGRLKSQGSVGSAFQLNSGHETKYFYGKPSQVELDRLFGTEVGIASHYLKNMVVDPNGQISVSYINASGNTVATALAGAVADSLHALPSSVGASTQVTDDLMQPEDFVREPADYSITASATFLAPVTGTYILNYRVDPLKMEKLYGPNKDSVICNNCYYDLEITIKDNCNNVIRRETRDAGVVFDTTCATPAPAIADTIGVEIQKIGEYYVTYRLVISRDALDFYDSTHLVKNSDIKKINFFLLEELKQTDFYGCYSNCATCLDALGTKADFTQYFKTLYLADSLTFYAEDSLWVLSLYDSLYAHCQSIQSQCGVSICDEKLELLRMDIQPGGQYALYDTTTYTLLEPTINVLGKRNQIVYFTDEFGNRDSVVIYNAEGGDSVKLDVKDLSDSLFIAYWKDVWADSLVRLHPEYCYYLWCVANSASFQFDKEIANWIDADTAMARGWFNPNVYDTILAHDPFFLPGGNGYALRNTMRDTLKLFSRTVVRTSLPDRNILQYIDAILYCKNQANGWEACNPDSACRSRNREWFLYNQLYLNVKQRFYEEARRTSSNPIFANCVNCYIGKDLIGSTVECTPPPLEDFQVILTPGGDAEPRNCTDGGHLRINYTGSENLEGKKFRFRILLHRGCDKPDTTILVGYPKLAVLYQYPEYFCFPTEINHYVAGSLMEYDCEVTPRIDSITVLGIECGDAVYSPFTDSTCNYNCPGGVYNPYDKDNISVYVEYGNPNNSPSGTPAGYGNCQFFSAYLLQTGANTSCKFFNVWVCTYDSTCGGVCSVTPRPSRCPDNPDAALYQNKTRRYPEYVNPDDFINNTLNSNPRDNSEQYAQEALSQCSSYCEAQADVWINQLSRCSNIQDHIEELKQAFIEICSAGCSLDRPFGVSSIPLSTPATYHSFEEAILAILGPGVINDSCTAELFSNPYPYDKQPVFAERMIVETNYEICQKISQYRLTYLSSGFSGSFHNYLTQIMGSAYQLDSLELADLLNSCTNCSGILKNDIVLPAFFEPNSTTCLLCDSVQTALIAFNAKFDIDSTNDNYELLFSNFLNHRFGYALTFEQYKAYLDSCDKYESYAGKLCNQPVTVEGTIDINGNSCVAELFGTALTNAANTYITYIDSVRRDFREAYMTRCLNVQPRLTMSAELYEYHYTLYYYDQAGNLVKTIPPEGVVLLNEDSLELVKLYRLLQSEGCYQYSDSILFNNNGQINWNITDTFEAKPFTVEMMANLDAYSNQVLVSKLSEYEYDTSAVLFYKYAGFVVKLQSSKLAVDVYGIGADTTQRTANAVSVLDASAFLPLDTWRHIVVQRTGNPLVPVRVYVNGNPVALQFTANDLDSASIFSGDSSLIVGSYDAPNLTVTGRLRGSIKNLRVYNRVLLPAEIRQNTYNNCQTPVNKIGLLFWSAMNNADSNKVQDLVTQQFGLLTGFDWEPFAGVFPVHRLPTTSQYSSFEQVVKQFNPDADTAQFFYDRLGRLTASQNKEQKSNASYSGSTNRFSYTKYDGLGRIVEVGEKSGATDIRNINLLDDLTVNNWLASGTDRQVVKTIYDNPVNISLQSSITSRKRVVANAYLENGVDAEGDSTLYSYDILGNVSTLVQHVKALVAVDITNGKKRVDYDYDLASGKVNMVSYQAGKGDQFFYKYQYDADNRVIRALTSRDKLIWNEDASYLYYLHGPLARAELGNLKVQGIDYAYTLQGWLKGINSDTLSPAKDIGNDGLAGSIFNRVSRDVYGMQLGYYTGDYQPIGANAVQAFNQGYTPPSSLEATGSQLFNGIITYASVALSKINNGTTIGYSYGYDQLNRLVYMRQHTVNGNWSNSNIIDAYSESIAYDANGNILKYLRRGADNEGLPLNMDSLTYKYNRDEEGYLVNNRLKYVKDSVNDTNYSVDIDDQVANNYSYDKIGNLVKDVAEGLDTLRWTMYGKVNRINKNTNTTLNFGYDASGNRTLKQVINNDTTANTYYIRDGQGNVLAIYNYSSTDELLKWSEQYLYGSSRLGVWQWDTVVPTSPPVVIDNSPIYDSLLLGSRVFELSNHLGNVLATISEKKIGNDSSGITNYYFAEVLSQHDYYPFGMLMPDREYDTASNYRYGFNGKENDNEVKGEGNQLDYGMRAYDPRIGQFLSLDPLQKQFPFWTPYQFSGNNPIKFIDLDGKEPLGNVSDYTYYKTKDGKLWNEIRQDPKLGVISIHYVYDKLTDAWWTIAERQNSNDNHLYYWKGDPSTISSDKGLFTRYETGEERDTRLRIEFADGMGKSVFMLAVLGIRVFTGQDISIILPDDGAPDWTMEDRAFRDNSLNGSSRDKNSYVNRKPGTKERVMEIFRNMKISDYQKQNVVTIAVADVETPNGQKFRLIGINTSVTKDEKIMKALRATLKPGEYIVPGMLEGGHAEQNINEFSRRYGLIVKEIDPSRPFCATCSQARKDNNSRTSTRTTNRRTIRIRK